ncbi:MAG: GTPase ObgE [Candidatus Eremiobacteraeota bacterium]|nr:GTPase ObgE [Candidatus Eremiobacteraeota bacterium]
MVAWRREKYVPKGGPAGGDGGRGGHIFLEATPELSTLVEFRFKRHFGADAGNGGSTSNKSGRAGEDLIIPVPVGTLVYRTLEGQSESLLTDLDKPGERMMVAKGGKGGLGNQHFATSARQAPHFAEKGEPGEKCTLRLELRLLADCGVVGLPNAGKSTLLSVVSAARPKIADYPFTTLEPQLGVVRVLEDESFVMVDVPGLIEGAHQGAGLGDQFLRHVERTRVLLHLLDGAKTTEEILHDKATIEHELESWNAQLLQRPIILVVSKLDLPDAQERLAELREQFPDIRGISSATNEGIRDLVFAAWKTIQETPLPEIASPEPAQIHLTPKEAFHIEIDDGVYVISGERVERLAAMTDFDSDEGLARFEQTLAKMGVDKKLREMGAVEGDTIGIGGNEFLYS